MRLNLVLHAGQFSNNGGGAAYWAACRPAAVARMMVRSVFLLLFLKWSLNFLTVLRVFHILMQKYICLSYRDFGCCASHRGKKKPCSHRLVLLEEKKNGFALSIMFHSLLKIFTIFRFKSFTRFSEFCCNQIVDHTPGKILATPQRNKWLKEKKKEKKKKKRFADL